MCFKTGKFGSFMPSNDKLMQVMSQAQQELKLMNDSLPAKKEQLQRKLKEISHLSDKQLKAMAKKGYDEVVKAKSKS